MAKWEVFRGLRLRELDKQKPLGSVLPGLDIRFDERQLSDLVRGMQAFPGALEQAMLAATNNTRMFARREINKGLRGITTLMPAYIGKAVTSRKARAAGGGVEAEVRVASRGLPLGRYKVTPERPPQLKGIAVSARRRTTYKLRKSGKTYGDAPRDVQDSGGLSSLFVQAMGSGHIGVFYRIKSSGKIVQQWAPSVQYHVFADGFIEGVEQRAREHFLKSLQSELGAFGVSK
jgi:hypothetical protein